MPKRPFVPVVVAAFVAVALSACSAHPGGPTAHADAARDHVARAVAAAPPPVSSAKLRLRPYLVIHGKITPKSVAASGTGLFFAQNMIYTHTVTVYDRDGDLVKTIPDSVDLQRFGYANAPQVVQGGPVEAAFTPDHRYAWVTNYSMYGPGFAHEGHDACVPGQTIDRSFVYRISLAWLAVDRVVRVGEVPKYVAVTPDGRYVLVSNWCSSDLSVIDAASGRVVRTVALGPYPRGIAVDPSSRTAYVTVMGTTNVAKVDLHTFAVTWISGVGLGPRHAVISPDGRYLYVSLNRSDAIAKIDLTTDRVVARVTTGSEPRSMTIAPDGRSLYVVNYGSNTVAKVLTKTMRVVQAVPTNLLPIGITYDAPSREVWVSCYSGSLMVFVDGVSP
jgi:YVTN family beta-propeller protein